MSTPASDPSGVLLTVVVITRNEEATIERCLASIATAVRGFDAEIIHVDSHSTDRTVERARAFPITILQLTGDAILSPAAGRCVGTRRAHGKFVLFLDGDMILDPEWLPGALKEFDESRLAAIAGRIYNIPLGGEPTTGFPDRLPLGDVECLGGAGLYRRGALEAAGSFNPFMRGEEERELGYRLSRRGFVIRRRATPMAFHQVKPRTRDELEEKAGYFVGTGQMIRAYGFTRVTRQMLRSLVPDFVLHFGLPGSPAVVVILWLLGLHLLAEVLGVSLAAGFVILILWKGWRKVVLFLRISLLMMVRMLRGLRTGLPDAREFRPTVREFTRT